jgi:Uma2 family endonuclease
MQETLRRKATYADLEAAPPHLVAEILCGRLVTHPRPTGRHARSHFRLGGQLDRWFDDGDEGPGGWYFLTAPELHLGEDICVPELAGWRVERIPPPPAPDPLAPVQILLRPDWVCEVLSPPTEKYDRGDKRDIYAREGIGHLWLVDPRIETLEAFALDAGRWQLAGTFSGDAGVRVPPFDAVEIALGRIWPPRREASASETEG